jgi:hypothetical protein
MRARNKIISSGPSLAQHHDDAGKTVNTKSIKIPNSIPTKIHPKKVQKTQKAGEQKSHAFRG